MECGSIDLGLQFTALLLISHRINSTEPIPHLGEFLAIAVQLGSPL